MSEVWHVGSLQNIRISAYRRIQEKDTEEKEMTITIIQSPVTVRLLLCSACGIHTNHRQTKSGAWVCWCGAVYQEPKEEDENR